MRTTLFCLCIHHARVLNNSFKAFGGLWCASNEWSVICDAFSRFFFFFKFKLFSPSKRSKLRQNSKFLPCSDYFRKIKDRIWRKNRQNRDFLHGVWRSFDGVLAEFGYHSNHIIWTLFSAQQNVLSKERFFALQYFSFSTKSWIEKSRCQAEGLQRRSFIADEGM